MDSILTLLINGMLGNRHRFEDYCLIDQTAWNATNAKGRQEVSGNSYACKNISNSLFEYVLMRLKLWASYSCEYTKQTDLSKLIVSDSALSSKRWSKAKSTFDSFSACIQLIKSRRNDDARLRRINALDDHIYINIVYFGASNCITHSICD